MGGLSLPKNRSACLVFFFQSPYFLVAFERFYLFKCFCLFFPGYYIHGEASWCEPGRVVRLLSKDFPATSGRCMSFWYNMYGASMGSFNIYTRSSSGALTKIFSRSGNQGTAWINGKASIQSSGTYKVCIPTLIVFDLSSFPWALVMSRMATACAFFLCLLDF